MAPIGDVWASEHEDIEGWLTGTLRLSHHDAEELVMEAAAQLTEVADPQAGLLWRTAKSRAVDLLRRRDTAAQGLEESAPILAGRAIPTIETAMFRADFDRAFRQLPEEQAEAFALTELRGLTERETAEIVGVSQKTINRRCEAARTYLQKELS